MLVKVNDNPSLHSLTQDCQQKRNIISHPQQNISHLEGNPDQGGFSVKDTTHLRSLFLYIYSLSEAFDEGVFFKDYKIN